MRLAGWRSREMVCRYVASAADERAETRTAGWRWRPGSRYAAAPDRAGVEGPARKARYPRARTTLPGCRCGSLVGSGTRAVQPATFSPEQPVRCLVGMHRNATTTRGCFPSARASTSRGSSTTTHHGERPAAVSAEPGLCWIHEVYHMQLRHAAQRAGRRFGPRPGVPVAAPPHAGDHRPLGPRPHVGGRPWPRDRPRQRRLARRLRCG